MYFECKMNSIPIVKLRKISLIYLYFIGKS